MSGTISGVTFSQDGEDTHMRIFRGKSLDFDIIWGGDSPIDITGCEAVLQARSFDGVLMLDLSTGNGGITIDGPSGRLHVTAGPEVTAQVNQAGRYEVELTLSDGKICRVISGNISPIGEVAA